jgi:pSer/pThr/pTyr-binding forkhead associated (FHA) protein
MTEYPKVDGPSLVLRVKGHPLHFIKPNQLFKIGRNKGNDLLLADKTVSRYHAEIKWLEKYPIISDLSSTAGVRVDGEFVSYKHLYAMHHIRLGNSKIVAEFSSTEADTPTMVLDAIMPELTDSNDVVLFREFNSEDVEGFFQTTDQLHKFLIKLEDTKRTGTLSITGSLSGEVIFGGGKIKQARCGPKAGVQALQYISSFAGGSYIFTNNIEVEEAPLDISPTFFLCRIHSSITRRSKRY